MTSPIRTIRVNAASRAYDALVGPDLLANLGEHVRAALPGARQAFVFVDAGLPQTSLAPALASLKTSGVDADHLRVEVSEPLKSLATLGVMLEKLTAAKHERSHPVIAIGGGILGDTAGFAAATYRRGVPWINCPTTLLSMVDASVGGKTAVNISVQGTLKKNMAGAFHQPWLVLADIAALATLPDRIFRAGLAECVKHGLIGADWGDPGLFEWIDQNAKPILARDPSTLTELINRNVAIKARVVSSDECEEAADQAGGRALLNLGHTFAHAIEPMPRLSPDGNPSHAPLQHGEAVSLGLIAACSAAAHPSLALCDPALADRVRGVLTRLGLPTRITGLPAAGPFLSAMSDDKKVASGKLRLILPAGQARCRVVADPPEAAVLAGIDALRA